MNPQLETKRFVPRFHLHPFVWDVGLTTLAGVIVLVAGLGVISLVGRWMGAIAVGEYLLLRRVATWLGSGAQLGLGVALPRYVARAVNGQEPDQLGYLIGAILVLIGVTGALAASLLSGRTIFARWLFGSPQAQNLILPLVWMLSGLAAQGAVYGFYRGRLGMKWANALQITNIGLVPITAVLFLHNGHPVAFIVSVIGATMLAVSGLFLLPVVPELLSAKLPRLRPLLRELLRYGLSRLPGDFAANALFALGPVIAAHYLPISDVSSLLLGQGLLMAISLSVIPCGTVLLSKISSMIARNQMEEVRASLQEFAAGVLELSVFACLQMVVFADVLIRIWLGKEYATGIGVIQIALFSVPFYLFFVAIRSAIDAASVVAHNAHSCYGALACFLVFSGATVWVAPPRFLLDGIATALLLANAFLSWRTRVVAGELFDLEIPWAQCALPLLLSFFLAGASYVVHHGFGWHINLASLVLLELGMTAVFVGCSWVLGSTWLPYFWNLLVGSRQSLVNA